MEKYLFVLIAVIIASFGQIALKTVMGQLMPQLPEINSLANLLKAVYIIFKSWQILSILFIAGLGFFFWSLALTKFELSYVFPFMAIIYIVVLISSWLIFKENITAMRIAGNLLIALGVFLVAKSI